MIIRVGFKKRDCEDILTEVVEEILCRLPTAAHVCRLKRVSKTWCNLISHPSFLARFLLIQKKKQTSTPSIMINHSGDTLLYTQLDFATRMKSLLEKMGKFTRVIATRNDLVLCCKDGKNRYHCDYYIGNPWTTRIVALPRVASRHPMSSEPAVGFICEPYYYDENDFDKINVEYRFKVVRFLPPPFGLCFLFDIQVFSSETGEWRDYVALCRKGFDFSLIDEPCFAIATNKNGMLYWNASNGDVVRLGPFDNSSYQIHVIKFLDKLDDVLPIDHVESVRYRPYFGLGFNRGNMVLVTYKRDKLLIWELNEEEVEQSGEVGRENRMPIVIEELDEEDGVLNCVAFDPNELDICYLRFDNQSRRNEIYKSNIRTGESDTIRTSCDFPANVFGCRRTLWPTPIFTISSEFFL